MLAGQVEPHELAPAVREVLLDKAGWRVLCRAIDGIAPGQVAARGGAVVMGECCQERLQFGGRHLIERGQWLHGREHKGNRKGTLARGEASWGNRKGTPAELLGNMLGTRRASVAGSFSVAGSQTLRNGGEIRPWGARIGP